MTIFYQDLNKENIFDYTEYFDFTHSAINFLLWYTEKYHE